MILNQQNIELGTFCMSAMNVLFRARDVRNRRLIFSYVSSSQPLGSHKSFNPTGFPHGLKTWKIEMVIKKSYKCKIGKMLLNFVIRHGIYLYSSSLTHFCPF